MRGRAKNGSVTAFFCVLANPSIQQSYSDGKQSQAEPWDLDPIAVSETYSLHCKVSLQQVHRALAAHCCRTRAPRKIWIHIDPSAGDQDLI